MALYGKLCRGTTAPGGATFIETFQIDDGISHGGSMVDASPRAYVHANKPS